MTADRFSRVDPIVDRAVLGRLSVLIVGVGSGGSTVAVELARVGVGGLVLCDPDRLELGNVARHECDDRYVGALKVDAVADLISHRNPKARVETLRTRFEDLGPGLEEIVAAVDLVAVCADREEARHRVGRHCVAADTPAVFGGVYAAAAGGEVIRADPCGACYACVTAVLKHELPLDPPGAGDYGVAAQGDALDGAAGLGLDVRVIALLHAKVCLDVLLGRPGPTATVFACEPLPGIVERRWGSLDLRIRQQAECLVCGGPSR
jgi:hypothetical protein